MYEFINKVPLKVKEYKGNRVVTLKDIDAVHGRPEGTARKRFNDNKKHFIEGEDFFVVNQPSEIRTLGLTRPQGGTPSSIILITESGYLMLAKSLTDDLSWEVQRQLVNIYFKAKVINNNAYTEIIELLRNEINFDIEMSVNRALDKKLEPVVKRALDKNFRSFNKSSNRKIRTVAKALNHSITYTVSETAYFDTLINIIRELLKIK